MVTISTKTYFFTRWFFGNFFFHSARFPENVGSISARRRRRNFWKFRTEIWCENIVNSIIWDITQTFVFTPQNFCFHWKQKSPSEKKSTLMVTIGHIILNPLVPQKYPIGYFFPLTLRERFSKVRKSWEETVCARSIYWSRTTHLCGHLYKIKFRNIFFKVTKIVYLDDSQSETWCTQLWFGIVTVVDQSEPIHVRWVLT